MRIFPALLTVAFLAGSLVSAQAAAVKQTIKLHQDAPVLTSVDLGEKGQSDGDMLAFQAKLKGEGGVKATLFGLLITVDIPDGDDKLEDRSGQVFFDFGEGNSLVVAGRSVYLGSDKEMQKGKPQLRAVIGGTGTYIGASGQVTTTRNADGSYEHVIELVK